MSQDDLIKYEDALIRRVNNAISVTNKLLAKSEPQLIPYRKGFKWGFCNPDKKVVIDCVYDDIKPFNENMAMVKSKGRWGSVDSYGRLIIPCIYESSLDTFEQGVIAIKLNSKWGLINNAGNLLTPFVYDSINSFSDGLARVSIKGGTDELGNFFKYEDETTKTFQTFGRRLDGWGEYGFIDKSGKLRIPCILKKAYPFLEGFAKVKLNDKWVLIDKSLNLIEISDIEKEFKDGLRRIVKGKYPNEKYGYMDKNGRQVIPCIYHDTGWHFSEGLMSVKLKGKWGFIDKTGNTVLPFIYDYADNFKEGMAVVQLKSKWEKFFVGNKREKYGFIDKTGKLIVPCIYDTRNFSKGLARVRFKGNEGYINKEGVKYWED